MVIGHARVSATGQNLDRQILSLKPDVSGSTVTRFLPLSPFGFANAFPNVFPLSHSVPFLPFSEVIPEIFRNFAYMPVSATQAYMQHHNNEFSA